MAHHKSAKKRIVRNKKRELINTQRKSRIRSFMRAAREAIAGGDKSAAQAAFKAVQPELHRGVTKGILHKNTVARVLSRLNLAIKKMA